MRHISISSRHAPIIARGDFRKGLTCQNFLNPITLSGPSQKRLKGERYIYRVFASDISSQRDKKAVIGPLPVHAASVTQKASWL